MYAKRRVTVDLLYGDTMAMKKMKHLSLLLLYIMVIDVIATTRRFQFSRILRVAPVDLSSYLIRSEPNIANHAICAGNCKSHECLSYIYTKQDGKCECYSRVIEEDGTADLSITTFYFSKVIKDCSFIPDGYFSGVYHIKPSDDIIDVYCEIDRTDGPWTVIQRRINGDVDFYRNWTEYKNGFGDLLGEFWIGNDKLHQLTATPRVLRVELAEWNGTTGLAEYSRFQVASEDLNYRILVEGFSGHIYDAMDNDNGYSFTTYDRDNDANTTANCGVDRHSGWWHKKCTRANLNGRHQEDRTDMKKAMYWTNFPDPLTYYTPLKTTMMMIK